MNYCTLKVRVLELLQSDASRKEGLQLEFKRAEAKVPEDMWETSSAFANTRGGLILLGIDDSGKVQGVQNPERMKGQLENNLHNPSKVSLNLCTDESTLDSIQVGEHVIIAIDVRPASVNEKPVYINGNMGQSFYRFGSRDFKCSEEQIQQMVRDKSTNCPTGRVIPKTGWECIDSPTWKAYRQRMVSYKFDHPWVELDDKTLLEKLGGYSRDEETGVEGITQAGLLMFGTDDAIRRYFPRYQVNYCEYGDSGQHDFRTRWLDRIYPDGTWAGNLYQFFFRVLPKLTETLKQPFILDENLIAMGETDAHKSVRESLANAIIHADYYGQGGVMISRYPDRIELSNPGTLLVPLEQIRKGGVSVCRNIGLQTMFLRIGIVEKMGSGYDTILRGWLEEGMIPPMLLENNCPARVTCTLPLAAIINREEKQKLQEYIGLERYQNLDSLRRVVLHLITAKGELTSVELGEALAFLPKYRVHETLKDLEKSGYLHACGRASGKTYGLRQKQTESESKDLPSSVILVRKKKRAKAEEMKQAILDLCRDRWMGLLEIAAALDRHPHPLRYTLRLLEAKGNLEFRFPENETHPKQAYRTREKMM